MAINTDVIRGNASLCCVWMEEMIWFEFVSKRRLQGNREDGGMKVQISLLNVAENVSVQSRLSLFVLFQIVLVVSISVQVSNSHHPMLKKPRTIPV